ncbi:MAG: efflux RND transporter permease subunit [Bacteroidetes bacterium]|nr:efflux RND transporter permease subunit [Bacteroidota bacterium]
MNIPKYSLDNSKVVFFFLFVLLIGGLYSFGKLGKKEDAPFIIKNVVLITQYPGATPKEVELLITEPIEREIQTLEGVYKIKSESYYGLSKINVEIEPSTSPDAIPQRWDELRRKVLNVQPKLPKGSSTISVNDDFGDVYGIYYALVADDGFSFKEMRDIAQDIKTQLVIVDNVQKVSLYGEQTEVVNVYISTSTLSNIGVNPNTIVDILTSQNKLVNTGTKQAGDLSISVVASGTYQNLEDIKNQIITSTDGTQIRLGDFARIERGYLDPPTSLMRVNGKRAIGIGVSNIDGSDVVKTGEDVAKRIEQIKSHVPYGLEISPLYLENDIAEEANNGFILNLIESIAIVVFIIMIVMGLQAGVLIGSSLIFSISGTMLIMLFLGVGLNRTSLAGFIIAMGMLVDNAIVVTDNAQISIKRGKSKSNALIDGANGPLWGLLGATFIAIISFLPLYLAPSSVAEIVKPLFIVLSLSLGLSWILAMTQTPLFGKHILKDLKKGDKNKDPYDNKFYTKFNKILYKLIHHRYITLTSMVGLLALALVVMSYSPKSFFPNIDKPYFRADYFMPDGYSISNSEEQMLDINDWLEKQPSVKNVSMTVGGSPLRYYLASSSVGPRSNFGNMLIELTTTDSTKIMERRLNAYVNNNYPNIVVRSSLFALSPVPDAIIEFGFTGEDADTLAMLTNKSMLLMKDCDLVGVPRSDWGNKTPSIRPAYSQKKGQRLGVSRQVIANYTKLSTNGINMGDYREGDLFMPILLKDDNIDNFNLANISSLPVFTNSGETVSLAQVTDSISTPYDWNIIRRYQRQLTMKAQCDPIKGANTEEAYQQVYAKLWDTMQAQLPSGYSMKVYGEKESQQDSNAALAVYMPLTFFLIFATLLLLFKDYKKPLIILLMLPLIFIGVVSGLAISGKMLDFFAILGLLGLIGMNIKNAIVLVDQIGIEIASGTEPVDAVVTATRSRIIPVVMASGTTILGMLPLLPDALFGGMAATIMGGLFVATLLTIFILPVTYCAIMKIKK